ncbi:type IV secretion system protein VirB4 [Rheinheimera pacifica]|uniref:TraG/VirB4 family ATPase n=1 Tax=Rheinheimera pacifica TaxID=173990 RepID=UPI002169C035|nr:conjugal transfer protein TrbE [Rheinheimera pacifica]MCS4309497.1 type IV secretion system protein VirB4 [Rheinheimera pacifica]
MYKLSEHRKKREQFSSRITWAGLVSPHVVLNKTGTLMSSFRIRGHDLDSVTPEYMIAVVAGLNNTLRRLGSGWALLSDTRRRETVEYPNSMFPDPASLLIDEERRIRFQEGTRHYETEDTLTFVWLPPSDISKSAGNRLIENSSVKQGSINRWADVDFFTSQIKSLQLDIASVFSSCELLKEGELLAYLHNTVSTNYIAKVAMPDIPFYLDSLLVDEGVLTGLEPKLGDHFIKALTIRFFPDSQFPGVLSELDNLNIEYRFTRRYIALDSDAAEKELTTYRNKWFSKRKSIWAIAGEALGLNLSSSVDQDAVDKAGSVDDSIALSKRDAVSHGYYTGTLLLWDKDLSVASDRIEAVKKIIERFGYTCIVETTNAVQAFLGAIPGNTYSNVRAPMINTLNLCHIMPVSNVWAGHQRNTHLNDVPLIIGKTRGETPFRLVTHEGDVGHFVVLGPTGAGKSTLINLAATQFRRYKSADVIIFDKKMSAYVPTLAVGGVHYEIGDKNGLQFQPLRHIDDIAEQTWAHGWLCNLLEQENITLTPVIKDAVWSALNDLKNSPEELRTLSALKLKVQNNDIRSALNPYTQGGPFAFMLDGNSDPGFNSKWLCFEMEKIMNLPQVVPAVLDYMFHAIEKRFKGQPVMMILDEAWLFLDNAQFQSRIREWLKVLRDANVSVGFATQSLDEIAKSKIVNVILESCPTRIYLPNPEATSDLSAPLYASFGLNPAQITNLSRATKKRHYYYVSPAGSRMFELDLGPVQLAFIGSSGKENVALAKELLQKVGSKDFAVEWLKLKGLNDEADYLKEISTSRAA